MGEESVKGANMGVILIIFAAILALGLIIFMLARNMANEGLTNVSERLEAASQSEYSDFDQKVIVGQRVNSALNNFKGKRVAVLIATQGLIDKTALPAGTMTMNGAGITVPPTGGWATGNRLAIIPTTWMNLPPWNGDASSNIQAPLTNGNQETAVNQTAIFDRTAAIQGHRAMTVAFGSIPGRMAADNSIVTDASSRVRQPASSSGNKNDKQLIFVQYNALLEPTNNQGTVVPMDDSTPSQHSVIWWRDDHYAFSGAFRQSDGRVMFDSIFTNTSTTGRTEYVPTSARFNANLLKDDNGTILGIVLQQVGQ